MKQERPLWQIPVFWLVVGLPLASIVAGVGLVVVALRAGPVDAVPDEVQRVSQIQTADLGPDGAARRAGLSAVVRIEAGVAEAIPVAGSFARGEPLHLRLVHPVQASRDRELVLQPAGAGWRAERAQVHDHDHDWILQLAPADGRWRLRGRLPAQQHAARLAAAAAAE